MVTVDDDGDGDDDGHDAVVVVVVDDSGADDDIGDDSEDDGSQADGVDAQLRELWEDILCCETFTMQRHADSSNSRNVILVLGKESEPLHRTPPDAV